MQLRDRIRLASHGAFQARFSCLSNTLAIAAGLLFFGALLSVAEGVTEFLERYYTRTQAVNTLMVYQQADSTEQKPFDADYRRTLATMPGVDRLVYHDLGFAEISLSPGRSTTVALRSAVADDPEIERLERIAGTNLMRLNDPQHPPVVISLNRAQRLADHPPDELIGRELAIDLDRSLRFEDESERVTLYGTIVGIVNETPEDCVYLDYAVMAMITAWRRDRLAPEDRAVDQPAAHEGAKSSEPLGSPSDDSESPDARSAGIIVGRRTAAQPETARDESDANFAHRTFADAWQSVSRRVADDTLIYPHLRLHLRNLEAVAALREHFRREGLATTSVLDDVAAVRDLRNYALLIGAAVGFLTLIAAMCSIFNTILASVERRTVEIGILRSLGASATDILSMFVLEGMLTACLGTLLACGALALGCDTANTWLLARLASNPEFDRLRELQPTLFVFPGWLAGVVALTGMTAAICASILPALVACRVQPAEALRHA